MMIVFFYDPKENHQLGWLERWLVGKVELALVGDGVVVEGYHFGGEGANLVVARGRELELGWVQIPGRFLTRGRILRLLRITSRRSLNLVMWYVRLCDGATVA